MAKTKCELGFIDTTGMAYPSPFYIQGSGKKLFRKAKYIISKSSADSTDSDKIPNIEFILSNPHINRRDNIGRFSIKPNDFENIVREIQCYGTSIQTETYVCKGCPYYKP